MSKPDWKDSPTWAKYLAMDDNGDWFWYEIEPDFNSRKGRWYGDNGKWIFHEQHMQESRVTNGTLERRP
jgi:hypothetical protein